jgi:3-hydroxyacyl-CoA dehydrogenase/enoyl-CoA hydratase/3-hydroxybutyryl-CoA epimerase
MEALIRSDLDAEGVLVAVIDMPGRTMNVFSADLMDALDALMDRVDADPEVRSVVLTSGKASFLAGADLLMVRGFTEKAKSASHDEMFALCGRLGRQFLRLEASGKPWVAAVNGIALGGGLELALACRARLVANDVRVQLGVPEVRLGLLPGAGGTQRLPRLAGFEPGMQLLLSGRSMAPAEAVKLGVFERAVPADKLLDEAKATARALMGKAYDPATKFPHLAQADVPPHDEAATRAIAVRHGIAEDDFVHYPAYGAIVDCVLKGARLPLDRANDVEMEQFLRLMFSPVAGRMVRTLFLERLRAERELAAPEGAGIERMVVGPISSARQAWQQALSRAKLPQSTDASLPADTLDIVDRRGTCHRVALRLLDEAADEVKGPVAVLAPLGPYGRVIEITGASDLAAHALAALAAKLWCLPWRTAGEASVLRQLRGQPLLEQTRIASAYASRPDAGDPAFIDVAACLAGVTPAYTGGPLSATA